MDEDWDADFTPCTIQGNAAAAVPSKSGAGAGHSVGRGRGFVGKPQETKSFGTSSTNGWNSSNNNSNDSWNISSSKQFDDADSGGWNSGGGSSSNDGGRNTGFGGGQKRNNACFKCGEEGHMSRECPKSGGDSQRRGNACFKCGEEGHMSRECPKSGSGDGQKRSGCFKCGEDGHMSRDCPNSGSGDGQKRSGCFKCGEDGHISRDCPNADSSDGQKKSGCFKCGEDGHISKDCPKGGGRGCFKCGEEGHMSKECPNPEKTRTTVGEDGKPREIYVPPDYGGDDDEDLSVPAGINFSKYDDIRVEVTGTNVPKPILNFSDAGFSPTLSTNIAHAGYTTPTPVQKYTIPIVRAGRDIMACAQTGSGKTAAFILPIIQTMFEANDLPNNSFAQTQEPWAVIMTPTRELSTQIYKEANRFAKGSIVKAQNIYGGTSTQVQMQRLSRGCHILIATPGRLDDFVEKGKVSFSQVKFFILDEADRMLDMGFGPAVRKMMEHSSMPAKHLRQTLLFSATFPDEIQKMAGDFLKDDYLFLRVGIVGAANTDVTQTVLQVEKFGKRDKLLQILQESGSNHRTLVFVDTKRQADFVASFISQKNFICTSIHGDRLQREREEALNDFRFGRKPILTATAVAARGLDIKDVTHVINYDMPNSIDEYVHRIGRTGRVGNTGQSTSFFDPSTDGPLANDLIKILASAHQEVPDWLESLAGSGGYSGGSSSNFASRDVRQGTTKSTWKNDNIVANGEECWD